jgi:V/A-type H+-transporting ATPase subunit F
MKVRVIGHPEAVLGFSLTGVEGHVATTTADVNLALDEALSARDLGVILITQEASRLVQARMDHLKLHSTTPLVVEIPSPEGADKDQPTLSEVVLRAIGIRF